ncbi:MAG: M20/M25/M40 family metallo-hydrolase [Candidatus Saganbacteria bacterium]|nr:M20/M25/M40 family metallo-hydrolase [Candidatus Saganbacteria bacterium]
MINQRRLIKTFKQLVRIDSLSLREGKINRSLRQQLRALGLRAVEAGRVRGGEAGSLIVTVPGRGASRPRLLLNAHTDTVSPGRGIKPVEKDGVIRSDGKTILGADNKAGVAALLEILRTIKERELPHPPLRVIFTVAEEIGLNGAKALPGKYLKADFGLAIDGGEIGTVVNRAPTQYNLTATIVGRAAHAGLRPEEGINAIKVAGEAIARMKLGRIDRETTANLGLIKGGVATNVVPAEVELRGEARSHNAAKLERQVEHMERTLFKACRRHRARLKLKVERAYRSFTVKETDKFLAFVTATLRRAGLQPVVRRTGGGSDANIFNERGIPSIILGVGADRVHTLRENIRTADLIKGTENILAVILGVAAWTSPKNKR